jgi:hypothetical protein
MSNAELMRKLSRLQLEVRLDSKTRNPKRTCRGGPSVSAPDQNNEDHSGAATEGPPYVSVSVAFARL